MYVFIALALPSFQTIIIGQNPGVCVCVDKLKLIWMVLWFFLVKKIVFICVEMVVKAQNEAIWKIES